MCQGCYEHYGSPLIDNPRVRRVVEAINEVYRHHLVGGSLHIVLDDWNLEDEHLDWCRQRIGERDDEMPEEQAACWECYEAMRALSMDERASALALANGYINPDIKEADRGPA